jgi:membrane-associated phospholipid phosphatase
MTNRSILVERLTAVPLAKARVLGGLTIGICVPYFLLQELSVFPDRALPEFFLDRWISFSPSWTPLYLSVCGLVPLSVLLAVRETELRSFARGLTLLCVCCFAGFVLFPAAGPRPSAEMIEGLSGAYPWLVSVDGPRNAFPSLHAGLTIFCMAFALRVVGARGVGRTSGWLWALAILFGTLATKQHFVVDVVAGAVLGGLAYAFDRPAPSSALESPENPLRR